MFILESLAEATKPKNPSVQSSLLQNPLLKAFTQKRYSSATFPM
ncbi:hypothetical protein S7335_3004 [Synechococcus sp. PCC 7335]|nr:hypothetical protein S7335_3004 [Synechococcus sp. PCC 7335]